MVCYSTGNGHWNIHENIIRVRMVDWNGSWNILVLLIIFHTEIHVTRFWITLR